jgi:hypothetical protein
MKRTRSKNLDDNDIQEIVEILDGWSGRLSWDLLIDAVEVRRFNRYTRQTLYKHERIRHAFGLRKKRLADGSGSPKREAMSSELQAALGRIARLEAENARLRSENNRLLEQFVRWSYNAHTRGLNEELLNRSLPHVIRGQTIRADR